ncbi:uncharacterized protein LOC100900924 [Galendromus occidentalis]|uniref:Uncharacterized protein LOC100900924 n=1 Tax=Galendromus occidentalis TaxID=34638 RepID=A0AAJ7P9I9_9ACAR|nr:uncharacterized protein LOC100900924 [Galendromus occidentalis]
MLLELFILSLSSPILAKEHIYYLENHGPPDSITHCIDVNNYATIYLTQTAWRVLYEYQRSVAFHFPFNMTGDANMLVVRIADFNFGSIPCTTEHLTINNRRICGRYEQLRDDERITFSPQENHTSIKYHRGSFFDHRYRIKVRVFAARRIYDKPLDFLKAPPTVSKNEITICPENQEFYCKQDQMCISQELWCDGIEDCSDGEDERVCLSFSIYGVLGIISLLFFVIFIIILLVAFCRKKRAVTKHDYHICDYQ